MSFSVSKFTTALAGGARPNLFDITITNIPRTLDISDATLLCKATTIPATTIGVVEVPFRGGRRIKLPGDRTFAEWSATFISDEEQTLLNQFHIWMSGIKDNNFTSEATGSFSFETYASTININHYNDAGDIISTHTLLQAFPTDIAQVDLSYDNTDVLGEFTVTFQYSHLLSSKLVVSAE